MSDLLRTKAWDAKESPTDLGYTVDPTWPQVPRGRVLGQVAGVAADSQGRIYLFHRGDQAPPLLCFDSAGVFLFSWDEPKFSRPHMVTIDKDDMVWLIDDGGHVIYQFTPDHELVWMLGVPGRPDARGTHFDQPTDISFNSLGEMYVSDGYGNKRVAKFGVDGRFLLQWGSLGEAPGQFALPHVLHVGPDDNIHVADRENWRIQIFGPQGEFLDQWTHIGRPSDLIFTPEGDLFTCDHPNGRVTKVNLSGEVLGFFGTPGDGVGQLSSSHDIAYCPNGDLIVGQLDGRIQMFRHS